MALYHLIYQSQALTGFSVAELTALLQKSWTYNLTHSLTGMLLHAPNGQFLQVLEGEAAAVRHLYYHCIATDPRHEHLVVLSEGPSAVQVFTDWCMSFRADQPLGVGQAGYLSPSAMYVRMCSLTHAPPGLLRLLLDFAAGYDDSPMSESMLSKKR